MTKRGKGNEYQRWVCSFLEGRGWKTRNFPAFSIPIKIWDKKTKKFKTIYKRMKLDFWGADIIARRRDNITGRMRQIYIQASLDSHIEKRVEEYKKYFEDMMEGEALHIWIKVKPGEHSIRKVVIWHKRATVVEIAKIIRKKIYYSRINNAL